MSEQDPGRGVGIKEQESELEVLAQAGTGPGVRKEVCTKRWVQVQEAAQVGGGHVCEALRHARYCIYSIRACLTLTTAREDTHFRNECQQDRPKWSS